MTGVKIKDQLGSIAYEIQRISRQIELAQLHIRALDARFADQNYRITNQIEAIVKELKHDSRNPAA